MHFQPSQPWPQSDCSQNTMLYYLHKKAFLNETLEGSILLTLLPDIDPFKQVWLARLELKMGTQASYLTAV